MKKVFLTIILPTYNEAENITKLIKDIYQEFAKSNKKIEVIVVDDNSPDKTAAIAKKLIKNYPSLKVIKRLKDHGLTQSIETGIDHAIGEFIAWMDADFSHPPNVLFQMSKLVPANKVVIASRFYKTGQDLRKEKIAVILSKIINSLAHLLISKQVTDYTSGFIILEKNIFTKIKIRTGYGEYFIDLVKQLVKNKISIIEYPFTSYSRIKGVSKTAVNISDFLKRGPKYLLSLIR